MTVYSNEIRYIPEMFCIFTISFQCAVEFTYSKVSDIKLEIKNY
jgi:hypothetical protein